MPISQTQVSGVAYNEQGAPVAGVVLKVVKAVKSGVVIQLKARTIATSNASGVFERSAGVADFLLPRNSNVWLSGKFYNGATRFDSSTGVSVAIPDSGTATLESLGAAAVVPVQGVTVQSNGTPLADLIVTFNFTTGLTATESPTGTVVVAASAVAPAWGAITGTLSSQTDLNNALIAKAPLVSPSFTTPTLGVASATSINKWAFTAPTTAATLVAGGDSQTYTFPATSATLARIDAGNAFIGNQTIAVGQTTSAQTDLLINPTTKASGNLIDLQVNSVSFLKYSVGTGLILGTAGAQLNFTSRGAIVPSSDGVWTFTNNASNDFTRVNLGGTTSSFPSIKRNSTALNFRLADDSGDAPITAGTINGSAIVGTGSVTGNNFINSTSGEYRWSGQTNLGSPVNSQIKISNSARTGFQAFVLGATVPSTIGAVPAEGQTLSVLQAMELLTIAAAPTTTTTMQVPAGAIVLSVSVRVTTVIPTAATFTVKIGAQAFNTVAVPVAATTTDMGTAAGAWFNATAQGVVITPNLTPGAATGVVRITVSYILITPPTS